MAEPRPSDRRLGRATIAIIALVVVIIVTIFVTYNISHYRSMEQRQQANGATGS